MTEQVENIYQKTYGVSITELLSHDQEELAKVALALVADMTDKTPKPLNEVLDDLARDSEELTSGTHNTN